MDDAQRLAKLTEREKEALRLWLDHKTAKEMAIDLGISHYAVEKRLRMARAKLGVTTSIEAARLLEAAEGYKRAGPQSPDLEVPAAEDQTWFTRKRMIGVIAMFLALAAALVLAQQSFVLERTDASPPAPPVGQTTSIVQVMSDTPLVKLSEERIREVLLLHFAEMDADRSQFIEAAEAPDQGPILFVLRQDGEPVRQPGQLTGAEAQASWIAQGDTDGDARIDEAEFVEWLYPYAAIHGVPADWVPVG